MTALKVLALTLCVLYTTTFGGKTSKSILKELNDSNFEHDTQATTGSTTGDWFVRFCDISSHCSTTDESFGVWGKLAEELNRRVSVAYVDL